MDPAGAVTSYGYDALNRITAQSNGAGQGTGYGYDFAGHLTALTWVRYTASTQKDR